MRNYQHKHMLFFLSVTMIFSFLACNKDHIKNTGKQVTEVRQTTNFSAVHIYDNIETHFYFQPSKKGTIEITGGENLLPHIQTSIEDSVLVLRNNNKWNWIRSYKKSEIAIKIYTDTLNHIIYKGYRNLTFHDTLKVDFFRFESFGGMGSIVLKVQCDSGSVLAQTGSPDIYMSGNARSFYMFSHAHGKIDALSFPTDNMVVHSRGSANIWITCMQTLGATIEHTGNVYYRYDPLILWKNESHQGRLIKIL
jgi:hypothetical protein